MAEQIRHRRWSKTLPGLVGALMFAACAAAVQAQDPAAMQGPREQVAKRLVSVGTLIEQSSAAKQIEASGVPEAAAQRGEARELHRQAGEAYQAEDYAKATGLLEQASRRMFEAVKLAKPEQVTGQKKQQDYAARKESVDALLDALKRINTEKRASKTEVIRKIETLTQDANAAFAAGDVERARSLIDQAYVTARMAIESLRGGDTLVRSLNFATKEEEYHYEVDRNETHQMLIRILVTEKQAAGAVDPRLKSFVDRAGELRKAADQQAGKKNFDEAVRIIEESTKELQRAIRNAGIFIPG